MYTQIISHRASKMFVFALRLFIIAASILPVLGWSATPSAIAVETELGLEIAPLEASFLPLRAKQKHLRLQKNLLSSTVPLNPAQDLPPVPLPVHCDGVTPPEMDPPTCCVFGYVYYGDEPVAGVSVRIESTYDVLTTTTTSGGDSDDPYYSMALGYPPISATVGMVITFTASYSDMVSARTWTVQSNGQQVDLGLVAGYQSPVPVSVPLLP